MCLLEQSRSQVSQNSSARSYDSCEPSAASIRQPAHSCQQTQVCLHLLCHTCDLLTGVHHSRHRIMLSAAFQRRSAMMRSSLFLIAAVLVMCQPAASRELSGAVSSPAHCQCRSLIFRPSRFTCRLTGAHSAGVSRHVRGLHMHTRQGLHRLALDPAASPGTIGEFPRQQPVAWVNTTAARGHLRLLLSLPAVASSILRQLGGPICANPCMSTHPSPLCHLGDVGRCGAGGEATQTHAVDTSRAFAIWLMPSNCFKSRSCSESCSVRRR